ncbi:hypothetical protein [Paraburkholderia tropica]|uniref:hypothetical protein n=1 Tax=Paraburkholderia tropica TaxID=92647 RepID=UPI002ABE464A|nr:hypothetical protein [Paraburkholderia tropica]
MSKTNRTYYSNNAISNSVRNLDNFPFEIGASEWIVTQELRDKFKIHGWARINFDLLFSDRSRFTGERYRNMLEMVQKFIREKWVSDANGMYVCWQRTTVFIQFLVNVRKVTCLSDAWGIDQYVSYRKARGTKSPCGNKEKKEGVTPDTLYAYLKPVKQLWQFSKSFRYGLKVEPWEGKAASNVAGIRDVSGSNRVLPYDLDFFSGTIRTVHNDLVGAEKVCEFFLSTAPWQERIAAATRLRTAAALAFFAMEGMRPDEVYGLPLNCLKKGKLNTEEGLVDVTWIDGRIYKDKPSGGVPHRWLAADEVVLAVSAMEKLWKALEKGLTLPFENGGIPEKTAPAIVASRGSLFPKLRLADGNRYITPRAALEAIKNYFRSPICEDFYSEEIAINHKRFRPTIARAIARLRMGDVRYFMSHYGHSRWSITANYFATFADDELQGDINRAELSEGQAMIDKVLSSASPLQGRRGGELESHRREYATMTFQNRKEVVRTLQRGHNIRIGPQSLCMAKKGAKICPQNCLYEQEICINCDNGVIADFHMPFWEDMWLRNQELIAELPPKSPGWITMKGNQAEIEVAIKNLGGAIPA